MPLKMSTLSSNVEALPFYQALTESGRSLLSQGVKYKHCDNADIVLRQGQQTSGAYMVLEGRLRVYSISPNGKEATLYCIERGETCVLALNCLFNDLLYPAWVEAEMDTQVMVISGHTYKQLFTQEASVQELTVRSLSTLVFRLMEELSHVHGQNNRQRLAHFLLIRASADGKLQMTQQQLAQHLGTRREVVARILAEFISQGYVATGRGQLHLLDTDGLRSCSTAQ